MLSRLVVPAKSHDSFVLEDLVRGASHPGELERNFDGNRECDEETMETSRRREEVAKVAVAFIGQRHRSRSRTSPPAHPTSFTQLIIPSIQAIALHSTNSNLQIIEHDQG
jgi:hypothetical protein